MMFYNDLATFTADNILHISANPSHSGPELAPKSVYADTLAREVVLDKLSLVTNERAASATGEHTKTFIMKY